jgi:hypothetical protein
MNVWDGELFQGLLNSPMCQMIDHGPLHAPVKNFDIKRDEHQQLLLTTHSDPSSVRDDVTYPVPEAGMARANTDSITFSNGQMTVVATGVAPYSQQTRSNYLTDTHERIEKAKVNSIEALPEDVGKVHQLIEWVANVDTSLYAFPHRLSEDEQVITTRTLKADGRELGQTSTTTELSVSTCLMLDVAGHELYIGLNSNHKDKSPTGMGYILYKGFPSEEVRRKIRECLSFGFGRPLVYLGYSLLSDDFSLIGFKAISAYSIDSTMYKLPTLPPAPVSTRYLNLIDAEVFTKTVNALFSKYEEMTFRHISWIYWHAMCAPVHMASVHLGSGIEALQRVYRALNKASYRTALLQPEVAQQLQSAVLNIVETLNIEQSLKEVLRNKVRGLNNPPQSLMNERFFESLSLDMGPEEKSAWRRRNDAAHGNETDVEDYGRLIREIKLLRNLFHRIVLSMSEASSEYIDYYTYGFPARNLGESVSSKRQPTRFNG